MRATARTRTGRGILDRPFTSLHLVLAAGGLLLAVGIVMVFSASMVDSYDRFGTAYAVVTKQLLWIAVGLPAFWLGLRLTPNGYRRVARPALICCLVLLVIVLVPGIGSKINGARRWIELGPIQVQPSEPAKLALALWGARLLASRPRPREWRDLLVPLVPMTAAVIALVMGEPDLGTTLCFILVLFGLLWTVGAPGRMFGAVAVAAVLAVIVLIGTGGYRMARVTAYLDPFADRGDGGYQAIQGMYSLSTGGFFGAGLGQSKMKWGLLPNAHTDFIFAILGEELGLVGCLVVLALFATLAHAGLRIARRTTDPFVRLVCGAVTVWLTGQAIINIGYVTGLLPVTGIPLPFISFGGTSLVLTLFTVGMLASFARHEPAAAAQLRAAGGGSLSRLLRLPVPEKAGRPANGRSTRVPYRRPTARTAPHRPGRALAPSSRRPRPTQRPGAHGR